MRLLYVVQRYGESIAGGAEQHCREFAERLVARGHQVEIATTCAESYVDWANVFDAGSTSVNGVTVHRFPVERTRDGSFDAGTIALAHRTGPRSIDAQREWIAAQGPFAPQLIDFLRREHARFDCVIFFPYLYWPTWAGLRAIAGVTPCVLHPTAHPEPVFSLAIYDEVLRLPDALAFSTREEVELVQTRCPGAAAGAVIGVGVNAEAGDPNAFRSEYPELGEHPYLLYVGRVDAGKGAAELFADFAAYADGASKDVRLVLLGEPIVELPSRDDVLVTGFVDVKIRDAALAGALALVQPSRFESFSMVVAEAFANSRPALVQRECAATRGHVERSGGGLVYDGAAEFADAVAALAEKPEWAAEMGARGRRYVEKELAWDVVLQRYEQLLAGVTTARS